MDKYCVYCKHVHIVDKGYAAYFCVRTGERDLVTGDLREHMPCEDERQSDDGHSPSHSRGRCGPEGKYFVEDDSF